VFPAFLAFQAETTSQAGALIGVRWLESLQYGRQECLRYQGKTHRNCKTGTTSASGGVKHGRFNGISRASRNGPGSGWNSFAHSQSRAGE